MRNSNGIEAVRSYLSKISLNPAMILILSSLVVWPECSVTYAFDVDFLIALKAEFSARLKANTAGAGFCFRRDRGNFDACFGFQHDPHPLRSFECRRSPAQSGVAVPELQGLSYDEIAAFRRRCLADARALSRPETRALSRPETRALSRPETRALSRPERGPQGRFFWCQSQAVRTIVDRSDLEGAQPSADRPSCGSAISTSGSPGRRAHSKTGTVLPLIFSTAEMTSRME